MPKTIKVDDIVYAKWPGSTQYYKAIIIAAESGEYDVKFESDDSIETSVPRKNLMTQDEVGRVKSPSRRRSRSRSASPGRRRSRSRSPSRRKTSSPAKSSRSPVARQPRSPARSSRQTTKSEQSPKVQRVKSEQSVISNDEAKQTKVEEINSQEITTSTLNNIDEPIFSKTTVTRRTTRSVTRALEHESVKPEKKAEACFTTCKLATCNVVCFFKSIPCLVFTLIALVLPSFFLYGLYLSCKSKKTCTLLALPVIPDCSKFFSWKATSIVFGWYIFQLVLSALPLGRVATGPVLIDGKARNHCLNGLSQFVISMATLGGLVYYGKLPVKYLTVNYISLITAASLFSFIMSFVVYLASRNASSKEPSEGIINDFMKGRVVSARIGNFDLKMYAFKAGLITWVVLSFVFAITSLQFNWKKNISLLALLSAQGVYVMDKLCSEEQQLHTASLKSAKMGYFWLMTSLVTIPFFCSLQARYLALHPTTFTTAYYVVPLLMTVLGFIILVQSRQQKFLFRKNKYEAVSKGWEYIVTRSGKGILCDGWWAQLTHPNYFGDILQAVGWALLCGTRHFLPWMNLCMRLPMILCQANEDDKACQKKYDAAWKEYRGRAAYNVCFLIRELGAGRNLSKENPAFLILQALQMWYMLDLVVFEESLLYTATLSKEKFGYFAFLMMLTITPFFGALQVRYLMYFPVNLPWYCFVIPVILHVVGFYVYRTSLLQKFFFRKDLQQANKIGVKSIPTKDGRNILVDGFWGSLRHPNYTGDFMMNVAWAILCGFHHGLPWIWPVGLFALLVQMAIADDKGCAKRYGASWQEYRERVKYKFIPYVV